MTADVEITETLRRFVALDLLGDPESLQELTSDSPLLEWGVLDSLNTARLLAYIAETFGVRVPVEDVVAHHFRDLASITRLVRALRDGGTGNGYPAGPASPATAGAPTGLRPPGA